MRISEFLTFFHFGLLCIIIRRISCAFPSITSFQSADDLCLDSSVQWVRHPSVCSKYYLCSGGIASTMPPCPWGHVWSNSAKNCVPVQSRWDDCDNSTTAEMEELSLSSEQPSPTHLSPDNYFYDLISTTPDYVYYEEEAEQTVSYWDDSEEVTRPWWVQEEEPSSNEIYPKAEDYYEEAYITTTPTYTTAWSFVPECGISASNMIVGGLPSSEGSWPWVVSMRLTWANRHVCGGTLVHPRWIVTAAHCVHGMAILSFVSCVSQINNRWNWYYKAVSEPYHIIFTQDSSQFSIPDEWRAVFAEYQDSDDYAIVRKIDFIVQHPDFINGGNYPNDIALMRLEEPVDVTGLHIRHACLPSRYSEFGANDNCWIMGWGETKEYADLAILQELQVQVRTLSECSARWGRKRILNSQICVGDGDNGACNGDSGGPLVCLREGYYYLVGITSWGVSGCQTSGYPSVFTRVSYFEDWIDDHISSLS